MKILYLCMGSIFRTFYDLDQRLKKSISTDAYFYVTDPNFSENYIKKYNLNQARIIKEYSFKKDFKEINPNIYDLINSLDNFYPISYAINADRRLMNGIYAKYKFQPYSKINFNYDNLIYNSISILNKFFSNKKPEIVITQGISTFGIHLIYAFCLKYKIRFLNLRHTKIINYMTFDEGIGEHYDSIVKEFQKEFSESELLEARRYIDDANKRKIPYSGHRYFNHKPIKILSQIPNQFILALYLQFKKISSKNILSFEPNYNYFYLFYLDFLRRPLKMFSNQFLTKDLEFLKMNIADKKKYIFFPMHAEPEVSLSVYAKFYSNQINFIRNISLVLPHNYILIIKDHPRNHGRRTDDFLKEINSLSRVILVDYSVDSIDLIDLCSGVIMLSGFIGIEALLRNKPVYCFGDSMVSRFENYLPIFNCENYKDLNYFLKNNKLTFNKYNLEKFVASIIRRSESLELMTVLLGKKNRFGRKFSKKLYEENLQNMINLIKKFVNDL